MQRVNLDRLFSVCAIILYCVACSLPIFKEDYTPGITALLRGWIGIIGGSPVFFAWLANISFFISLFLPLKKSISRIVFSIISILLGLTFLAVKEIPISEGGENLDVSPGIGFYFWMASFSVLLTSNILGIKKARG